MVPNQRIRESGERIVEVGGMEIRTKFLWLPKVLQLGGSAERLAGLLAGRLGQEPDLVRGHGGAEMRARHRDYASANHWRLTAGVVWESAGIGKRS